MNGQEPIGIGLSDGYSTLPGIYNLTDVIQKTDMTQLSGKISDRLPNTIAALIK